MSTEPVQFWLKGWLSKQSRFLKKWRRRFVVLTNTQLLTYKDENINELTDFMGQQAEELEDIRVRISGGSRESAYNK